MRALSGTQATGKLHLGNYFGALRQYLTLQEEHLCYYFIADLHALTTVRNAETLKANIFDAATTFLAVGLDPKRSILFRQSDIPEVTDLTWILSTITPMGLLQRCHSYKDKVAQGITPDHGLFSYPVLMAADILIYDSNLVPVGQDQKQHLEVTRDIAVKFNMTYGETLVLPEPYILEEVAVVPGTDGRKMSKSYNNVIDMFAPEKELKKQIMGIVTDSKSLEEPKDPDACGVFALLKLFLSSEERKEWEEKYRAGGHGYGTTKKAVLGAILDYFGEARKLKRELVADPGYVRDVYREGAARARETASEVLERVRKACGLS